jgi:hypothetical protein
MRATYYVIFNRRGIDRFTKGTGFQLKGGEFVQQVNLEIDDRMFEKVKVPTVTVQVSGENVGRVIEAAVDDDEGAEAEVAT